MKSKNKLIGALALVLTFVAGYALGLLLDLPNIDFKQASGTIGRVNNYRNAKATESEIALKNDLLKDKKRQAVVVKYLNYYYARSLAFAQTTALVLEQAAAVPAFADQCNKMDAMKDYGKFLETSRKMLLLATLQCQSVESAEPSVLRNSLDQASNVIARMGQYQSMVLTFMDQLDAFLAATDAKAYAGLSQAYDQLLFDQVSGVLISKDKVLASYLNKKRLYASEHSDQLPDVKAALLADVKSLDAAYPRDMEKLGFMDTEKLGASFTDVEKLGTGFTDAEKLGAGFSDVEKLGAVYTDVEKLGGVTFFDNERFGAFSSHDAEKLGLMYFDAEKLGSIVAFDAEKLGSIGAFDAEKLGSLWDAEQLGGSWDSEQLGSLIDLINDAEQLGSLSDWINDTEQLGMWDTEQLGVISIE